MTRPERGGWEICTYSHHNKWCCKVTDKFRLAQRNMRKDLLALLYIALIKWSVSIKSICSQVKSIPPPNQKLNIKFSRNFYKIWNWRLKDWILQKISDIEQSSTLSQPGRISLEPFSSLLASTVLLLSSPFRESSSPSPVSSLLSPVSSSLLMLDLTLSSIWRRSTVHRQRCSNDCWILLSCFHSLSCHSASSLCNIPSYQISFWSLSFHSSLVTLLRDLRITS